MTSVAWLDIDGRDDVSGRDEDVCWSLQGHSGTRHGIEDNSECI